MLASSNSAIQSSYVLLSSFTPDADTYEPGCIVKSVSPPIDEFKHLPDWVSTSNVFSGTHSSTTAVVKGNESALLKRIAELEARESQRQEDIKTQEVYRLVIESNTKIVRVFGVNEKRFIRILEEKGETILMFRSLTRYRIDGQPIWLEGLRFVVTNKNVFRIRYFLSDNTDFDTRGYDVLNPLTSEIRKDANITKFEVYSLYTFNKPLNSKYASLLLSLTKQKQFGCDAASGRDSFVWENIISAGYGSPGPTQIMRHTQAIKDFESIIRIIPGSFQNGDWRQLDGFFGMYFNETTMEVSEFPSPMYQIE